MTTDVLWVVCGRVLTAALALLTIRVSTTLLDPSDFGLLTILLTFQSLCGLFLINPVGQYISRHTHQWFDDATLLGRMKGFRVWVGFSALCGGVAMALWSATVKQDMPVTDALSRGILVALMVLWSTWGSTWIWTLNMLGARRDAVLLGVLNQVLCLSAAAALAGAFSGAEFWFLGQILGMFIVSVSGRLRMTRLASGPSQARRPLLDAGSVREYILPLAAATGLMWFQVAGFRLQIEYSWGTAALGFLAVGLAVSTQLFASLENLAMHLLFPFFFRRVADSTDDDARAAYVDIVNVMGPIYIAATAGLVIGAPQVLYLLAAPQYREAVFFVTLGAGIELFRVLSGLLALGFQIRKRMTDMIAPYSLGAICIAAGLLWSGVYDIPLEQASLVLLVGGGVCLATITMRSFRDYGLRFDALPWCTGVAVLVAAILIADPSTNVDGVLVALVHLGIAGLALALLVAGHLLRSARMKRLMSVPLGRAETS